MSVELMYKHQQKTYELMKQALARGEKVAYVFPVGCGKSFPVLKYMEENPSKKILLISPNLGIIYQFKNYIQKYILGGKAKLTKKQLPNFRAITYQKATLATNICDLYPDVIILDEIHRIGAEKWEPAVEELLKSFQKAEVIGMSATPERTDKRNMAYEKFDNIVYEMSLTEALSGEKEGEVVLQGARYVRDLSQIKELLPSYKSQIESLEDEEEKAQLLKAYERLENIVRQSPSIQDVMEDALKKKNGKYIVFCSDAKEMFEKMQCAQEIFGKVNSNIKIDYVLSKCDRIGKSKVENRKTLEEFEKREEGEALNLLFCVDMLNEGVHLDGISGEVMFRPTESAIVYKQQVGRVLSSEKEKEQTVIVDAANNWIRQNTAFQELRQAAITGIRKREITETSGQTRKKNYQFFNITPQEEELLDILRGMQEKLRYNNKDTYTQLITWLETHHGKMPRGNIYRNFKRLTTTQITKEEQEEINLHQRWKRTQECKILKACVGIPIEELPLEYEKYKERIICLRSYGLGKPKKTCYEQIIEWLATHQGRMPRGTIKKQGKVLSSKEMTEEEREERNLMSIWYISQEYEALQACVGIPIEEIPQEYIEYKEKIRILRSYGLGIEPKKEQTTYEEIIEWLETHESKLPRVNIRKGTRRTIAEMSLEERKEKNLASRWYYSKECKALQACRRNSNRRNTTRIYRI